MEWGDAVKIAGELRKSVEPSTMDLYQYKDRADQRRSDADRMYNSALVELKQIHSLEKTLDAQILAKEEEIQEINSDAEVLNDVDDSGNLAKILEDNDYGTYENLIAAKDSVNSEYQKKLKYYSGLTNYHRNTDIGAKAAQLQHSKFYLGSGKTKDIGTDEYRALQNQYLDAIEVAKDDADWEKVKLLRSELDQHGGWDLNKSGVVEREEYEIAINQILTGIRDEAVRNGAEDSGDSAIQGVAEGFWNEVGMLEDINKKQLDYKISQTNLASKIASKTNQTDPNNPDTIMQKALNSSLKDSYGEYFDFITDDMTKLDLTDNTQFLDEMLQLHKDFQGYDPEGESPPPYDMVRYDNEGQRDPSGKSQFSLAQEKYHAGMNLLRQQGRLHYIQSIPAGKIEEMMTGLWDASGTGYFNNMESLGTDWNGADLGESKDAYLNLTWGRNVDGHKMSEDTVHKGPGDSSSKEAQLVFDEKMYNRIQNRRYITTDDLLSVHDGEGIENWSEMSEGDKKNLLKPLADKINFTKQMELKKDFEWLMKNAKRINVFTADELNKYNRIRKDLIGLQLHVNKIDGEDSYNGHSFQIFSK
tara:strand:- start:46492 stop:48252 length:1761 start_codon:yes stop_codon:yes gene_type:complete